MKHVWATGRRALACLAAATVSASCGDPVYEERIAALGPERQGVAPGPLHRPAQPCLACHDGSQSGVDRYSVAGTVYAYRDADPSAPGVGVELIDARGERFLAKTNCVGNFYVTPKQFEPQYPLWTSLVLDDYRIDMQSQIGRDGSCASCHGVPVSASLTDPVYVYSLMDTPIDSTGCE